MNWEMFFKFFLAWMALSAILGMMGQIGAILIVVIAGYVFRHNIIRLVKYGRW